MLSPVIKYGAIRKKMQHSQDTLLYDVFAHVCLEADQYRLYKRNFFQMADISPRRWFTASFDNRLKNKEYGNARSQSYRKEEIFLLG